MNGDQINIKKCEFYNGVCAHRDNCQGLYKIEIGKKLDICIRYNNPKLMMQKNIRGYFE